MTFPSRHVHAADFFFDIGTGERPWIAAVDGDGAGAAHVSTGELRGRKLFVWGTGSGGRRWQQWLSHGGEEVYAEIQAGLAPTQFEHLSMPARAVWSWTEAFGALAVDPQRSHRGSWEDAVGHVGGAIDELVPADQLDVWHRAAENVADQAPTEVLATGSGWGALERQRRHLVGSDWFDDTGTPFPDSSLGPDQEPWLELLHSGRLPSRTPDCPPRSYIVGGDWEARLGAATPTWLSDYLGAVLAHGRGDLTRAMACTNRHSVARTTCGRYAASPRSPAPTVDPARRLSTPWRPRAWRQANGGCAAEAVSRLLDDGRPDDALALLDDLPVDVRNRSRLRLLEAWAAHGAGDVRRAQVILGDGLEVAGLREGERSLDQLWNAVFPARQVPAEYDFRMVAEPDQRNAASDF